MSNRREEKACGRNPQGTTDGIMTAKMLIKNKNKNNPSANDPTQSPIALPGRRKKGKVGPNVWVIAGTAYPLPLKLFYVYKCMPALRPGIERDARV